MCSQNPIWSTRVGKILEESIIIGDPSVFEKSFPDELWNEFHEVRRKEQLKFLEKSEFRLKSIKKLKSEKISPYEAEHCRTIKADYLRDPAEFRRSHPNRKHFDQIRSSNRKHFGSLVPQFDRVIFNSTILGKCLAQYYPKE